MKAILKIFEEILFVLIISIPLQRCEKDTIFPGVSTTTTTAPTPTFTCSINGIPLTSGAIYSGYGENGNKYSIMAIYDTAYHTRVINLYFNYDVKGTYTLGLQSTGNYGTSQIGTNTTYPVTYGSAGMGVPSGTLIITSSVDSLISGTFNFIGANATATPTTYTFSGSFANVQM